MQGIAETGVDVPRAAGVLVGRQTVDGQHEVIGELFFAGTVGPVHPADVARHLIAQGGQQLGEGAVEMEAVPTALFERDATRRVLGSMPHRSPAWIQIVS